MKSIDPVFIDLALAVSSALECPSCPEGLRSTLCDVAAELIGELSPTVAFELRALAMAYPETEKTPVANPERKAMALNA